MNLALKKSCCVLFISTIIISCKKEYSCEGCVPTNKPPIAIAGNDTSIILPLNSTILDGSASSDPDGKIISYNWSQLSGPGAINIDKPGMAKTSVNNFNLGIYQFELIVKDDGGLTAKDTVRIEVVAATQINHPPVANAGPDQTILVPNNSVVVDGNKSTDPENNIVSYSWRYILGPTSYTIVNPNSAQTQITGLIPGLYQFELKVTDGQELSSKDTVNILVDNNSTVTNMDGNIIITLPLDSVYLGLYHYPDSYNWKIISGPAGATISNTSFSAVILVNNLTVGSYSFRYEEVNGTSITADTINVTVINDPLDLNTITFKDLHWRIADEYGIGTDVLSLTIPAQPDFFITWDTPRPLLVYLQPEPSSPWLLLPSGSYVYDSVLPHIWIMRNPVDASWVAKTSSVKIKFL
jgi:hypothetical protein